jgi:hypothetical protein
MVVDEFAAILQCPRSSQLLSVQNAVATTTVFGTETSALPAQSVLMMAASP